MRRIYYVYSFAYSHFHVLAGIVQVAYAAPVTDSVSPYAPARVFTGVPPTHNRRLVISDARQYMQAANVTNFRLSLLCFSAICRIEGTAIP